MVLVSVAPPPLMASMPQFVVVEADIAGKSRARIFMVALPSTETTMSLARELEPTMLNLTTEYHVNMGSDLT
jgi:hypothetical protein